MFHIRYQENSLILLNIEKCTTNKFSHTNEMCATNLACQNESLTPTLTNWVIIGVEKTFFFHSGISCLLITGEVICEKALSKLMSNSFTKSKAAIYIGTSLMYGMRQETVRGIDSFDTLRLRSCPISRHMCLRHVS